jgi:murein tripeptide amidase MpaA
MMPKITFDRFYRYDEITALLRAYADEFPQLVTIQSIGQSYEGRDIWLATITNSETGPADEKPAFWVDGNIHASELSASTTCLYLINKLTSEYGNNAEITRCLDTRVFYVCPRLNPDGAEWALADEPRLVRSSTRPYPFDEEPLPGFEQKDMDGDGRLLQMRIPDSNGQWKSHPDEPRLMVRRDPTEIGGQYYRVMPEGHVEDFDGVTITSKDIKEGLDFNRNYPAFWRQEHEQRGSGPYPTSEPEIHAAVDFIARNRNITGAIAFHTWSGVLLRPYTNQPDDKFPAEDLWTYQKIGAKGTEITDYPNISVYHDFRYHPNQVTTGNSYAWAYEHQGIFAWTVEIWSPRRQAGIEDYKFIDWYREHPVEDDFKLLKWSDEALDGQGYVDWYTFDHPQLGEVELGGWDMLHAWRNPPPKFLEKEIAPFSDWLIWCLLISPKLELLEVQTTPLNKETYHIRVAVHNTGWLPSYVTKKALEKKTLRGVLAEIELPEGATLRTGKTREDIGQLEGRAYTTTSPVGFSINSETTDRAKVEWIVYAPNGGEAKITMQHDRAGVVRTTVDLK